MPLEYDKPFYPTKLEEERETTDRVTVRLNREERRWLEALKLSDNEGNDSTALKNAAFRTFKELSELHKIIRGKK